MPRFAANLSMLFTEVDFLDRFAAAAEAGFSGVEYLFPYDYPAEEIKARLDANGLEQVLFNLPAGDWAKGERGIACHPDRVEEFRAGVDKAIAYAKVLGNKQVNCLAGIRPQGHSCEVIENTFLNNLEYAAERLEAAGITLVMEMINTLDIPGFYLQTTRQALDVREKVGSPNLFLQYDIYHMQIMEETWPVPWNATSRHPPRAAGRQPRPPRTGHRRDQLPLPLPAPRPHRLPGLGRLRVQARHHDRRRPGLAENPQRHLITRYSTWPRSDSSAPASWACPWRRTCRKPATSCSSPTTMTRPLPRSSRPAPSPWPTPRSGPGSRVHHRHGAGHPAGRRCAVPQGRHRRRRGPEQGGDRHELHLPTATKAFAEKIKATGATYLDAPVSGGEVGAKAATLSIMVGGCPNAFERALPLFQAMGKNITRVGGSGDGQTAKVANQIIVALNIQAVAEALLFAARNGADPAKVREALMGGFAGSKILEVHGERMIKGTFDPGFRINLHQKDLNLALSGARELGLNLPNTANAQQVFSTCAALGGSGWDHSALIKGLEHMANFSIRKE